MENNHNHRSWRHYYDWRTITIVKELNEKDINEILVVDNLKHGKKFQDLVDLDITEYMVRDDFLTQVVAGDDFCPIEAVSIYAPVQLRQDGIVNT